MGNCLKKSSSGDDGNNVDEDEEERRPTKIDRGYRDDYIKGGGKTHSVVHRSDSQLSKYVVVVVAVEDDGKDDSNFLISFSTDSQHVVEKPVRIGSFNVKK